MSLERHFNRICTSLRIPWDVAHFWSFDAQGFGVTIDAFTAGSLGVDGLVEGAGAIQSDAHDATSLDVAIFDTAFAFFELFMVTVSASAFRMQERTRITLSTIAVGANFR